MFSEKLWISGEMKKLSQNYYVFVRVGESERDLKRDYVIFGKCVCAVHIKKNFSHV
jgi:hypothetical protein